VVDVGNPWVPAEAGAEVTALSWGHSPEKYQFARFGTPEEALAYSQGMPVVETVTVANPSGSRFTFEGRFLREPSAALGLGATVERAWYTIGRDDEPYDDFFAARRDAGRLPVPATLVREHLVFRQPDGRAITQEARLLNLDPTRSAYNTRNADAFDVPDPP
jgi:hypothetical protein